MFRFYFILRQTILLLKQSKKIIFITIIFLVVGIVTLGATYMIGTKLFESSASLTGKINITAFFKLDAPPEDIERTVESVKAIEGVKSVSLITSEQAKQDFIAIFPQYEDIITSLKRNPLPYTAKIEISDLDSGNRIKELIKALPTIDSVVFSEETAQKLNNLVRLVWTLFSTILIVVISEFIFIVQSSASVLIDMRKTEINVLKLIGADRTFIELPFITLFSFFSFIAWILSTFILQRVNIWSDVVVQGLLPFGNVSSPLNTINVYLMLLLFSLVLGVLGSILSLRRTR